MGLPGVPRKLQEAHLKVTGSPCEAPLKLRELTLGACSSPFSSHPAMASMRLMALYETFRWLAGHATPPPGTTGKVPWEVAGSTTGRSPEVPEGQVHAHTCTMHAALARIPALARAIPGAFRRLPPGREGAPQAPQSTFPAGGKLPGAPSRGRGWPCRDMPEHAG